MAEFRAVRTLLEEGGAGVIDVVLQLRTDGIDAIELPLTPQEVRELNARLLAVEIASEVDEVCLEQRDIGVLVERRTATEVHRTRVTVAIRADVPPGVYTIGRQTDLLRHLDVRSRETDCATALVAEHYRTTYLERAPEQLVSHLDAPTGERTADRG